MASITLQPPSPPANWDDFESLCRDLWSRLWRDPTTQKNGRQGQPQKGVDVFGRPDQGETWAGVQCKGKNRGLGAQVTRSELRAEVKKARKFSPPLVDYVLATTAPSDAGIQEAARELTVEQLAKGSFAVAVLSWEEIWDRLRSYPDLVEKYFGRLDTSLLKTRRAYLSALYSDLVPLPLLGVAGAGRVGEIPLAAVYTALDTTTEVGWREHLEDRQPRLPEDVRGEPPGKSFWVFKHLAASLHADSAEAERVARRIQREADQEKARHSRQQRAPEKTTGRRLTALELAALARRLVLVGAPGSGKSTFARHLALCLAGDSLGREEANLAVLNPPPGPDPLDLVWQHGALLPIFVELRRLVGSEHFPREEDAGNAEQLLRFVADQHQKTVPDLMPMLLEELGDTRQRAILILDGLDETPAAEASRGRLRQVVASFSRRFPHCRVLLTSRPYAYRRGSPWRLDDLEFGTSELAEFDAAKIRAFAHGWYAYRAEQGQLSREEAERRAQLLIREIEAGPYLQPLAQRPLMLTMLTDLHAASGGHLRGGRAALFEGSVELLLDRWNEIKGVVERPVEGTVAELFGMSLERVREALESLAFTVHRARGRGAADQPPEIDVGEVYKALDRGRPPGGKPVALGELARYLDKRSGILLAEAADSYRFPHRYYQEFLAACHLSKDDDFPETLLRVVREAPALWREVVLFVAAQSKPIMVRGLVDELAPADPPPEPAQEDAQFSLALLGGLALEEAGVFESAAKTGRWRRHPVRQWLRKSLELGALTVEDRAEAGRLVGILGDDRSGVGLRDDGVPDIEWVEIPAGSFWMGSHEKEEDSWSGERPRHPVELDSFRISRYPLTNAQYGAFVADGGYTEKYRECWTKAGWKEKGERQGPDDNLPASFLLGNHPRVNVSWYEAWAFSQWLGKTMGLDVNLPSEEEWERAARGPGGSRYPWGDEFEADRCNSFEAGLGRTTAVGSFPKGRSADGAEDLAGNVWEWCRSRWRDYEDARDEDPEGTSDRVFRGGAFSSYRGLVRCAFRYGDEPGARNVSLGFRVSAPI